MSYFPSISQNVTVDTANSYSGTIDNGVTWNNEVTDLGTSTMGVNAIQVVVDSDKDLTIYVDQGRANNTFEIIDNYNYITTKNFGITIQAVSAYVRVRAKNSSGATATVVIDTVLCPIVECLPRSLDENGYLQVSAKSISDEYGFNVENTPTGEMRVSQPTRLIGAQFEGAGVGGTGGVDPNFWNSSVANSGTVIQGNAQVVLSTNTATNGTARLCSVRRARYISANAQRYRAVLQASASATNNTRRWGIGWGSTMPTTITITDGTWFQWSGTTFGIAHQKASANGGVAQVVTSFNGDLGSSYAPTADTSATYEIYWTNSKVWWVVGDRILHIITFGSATWADTMNFYIFADNINSSNLSTNQTLTCRVVSISRLGPMLTQPISYYINATTTGVILKYGPGNLHSIILGSSATSGSVITLYDGISATTVIARFALVWPSGGNFSPTSIDLKGIPFHNGLYLTIATQAAAVTVIYE
jgi:hypothetical protein